MLGCKIALHYDWQALEYLGSVRLSETVPNLLLLLLLLLLFVLVGWLVGFFCGVFFFFFFFFWLFYSFLAVGNIFRRKGEVIASAIRNFANPY